MNELEAYCRSALPKKEARMEMRLQFNEVPCVLNPSEKAESLLYSKDLDSDGYFFLSLGNRKWALMSFYELDIRDYLDLDYTRYFSCASKKGGQIKVSVFEKKKTEKKIVENPPVRQEAVDRVYADYEELSNYNYWFSGV
jgi:DNA-directed RNA polymerase delta subunit